MSGQRVKLTVRLDPDVKDALERLAQRENRSLSNMVQTLVKGEAIKTGCYSPRPLSAVAKRSG